MHGARTRSSRTAAHLLVAGFPRTTELAVDSVVDGHVDASEAALGGSKTDFAISRPKPRLAPVIGQDFVMSGSVLKVI